MTVDFNTVLSIVAILISIVAVAVSVQQALVNRPRIRMSLLTNQITRAGETFFVVRVQNYGTQPTKILHVSIQRAMHRNWPWLKWMVPELIILGDKDSDQFPAELPPGGNVELVVYQFRIREMLKEYPARHFWIAASHSWATKPKYTYFHPKLIQTLERA